MAYFYAALWVLVGVILIFRMGGENRVFYPIGGFFLILGAWWAAGACTGLNLFAGAWGWALRAITAAALCLACVEFAREMKKTREKNKRE
ncbi:hypothetical protein CAFE_28440 [Caprobacter fermentans]|uniref:Uncharacterized protein n=1 Tax=Caproicibacter fermentans TaxID=2576756 RepID=A0A6N8I2A2_9FIRM|nr:hypothetical protein [Caproicibacter fermentans]MVB12112.1 hypothetical protein [Caproicibacter fermentans]OCN01236.1 hypothetical protein A7X67_07660 [Clostridium sp. W14A]QNK39544.1 hypothetical protein HCR03_12430 [Caproicibacter fermentans]